MKSKKVEDTSKPLSDADKAKIRHQKQSGKVTTDKKRSIAAKKASSKRSASAKRQAGLKAAKTAKKGLTKALKKREITNKKRYGDSSPSKDKQESLTLLSKQYKKKKEKLSSTKDSKIVALKKKREQIAKTKESTLKKVKGEEKARLSKKFSTKLKAVSKTRAKVLEWYRKAVDAAEFEYTRERKSIEKKYEKAKAAKQSKVKRFTKSQRYA